MNTSENFQAALSNKKVPILVLDQKWHRLFAIHGKTDEIKEVEAALSALLAEQGKCNQELKDLKKLKASRMENIVQNMDENMSAKDREKAMEDNRRLIDEINEKVETIEDRVLDIPNEIHDTNEKLMLLSMDYFYEKLRINASEAKDIEEWITNIRIELKKNIIRKQNRDINNREIYAYLHDIFGAEVLDLFDIEYHDYFHDDLPKEK